MKSGALLRNGRSPARKRKLNEKMLRSSEAEMPISLWGIRQGLRLQSKRHRDSPVQESSFRSFPVQDYPYAEEHYVRQPDC